MSEKCPVCMTQGKISYFKKCFDCGAVFCPLCTGSDCVKCHSLNVNEYPGTHADLLDIM